MTRPINASELERWSAGRAEPAWLTARRIDCFARLRDRAGFDWEALRAMLDRPEPACPPLAAELAAQGVELTPLSRAARESLLVRSLLSQLADPRREQDWAYNGAFWTGGYFVRVPPGVRACMPLQLSASLSGSSTIERVLIVLEESAELFYVEGCAQLAQAPGRRSSVVEAFAGPRAALRCVSVQSWSGAVESDAWKLARAAAGASVEWLDANLGGARVFKTVGIEAAGAGACARVAVCGLAARGQRLRLRANVSGEGFSAAAARLLAARRGGELEVLGCPAEIWTPESLSQTQRFYLATRGFSARQAEAAALHAFFEPFTRQLPLEFAVEMTRLIDAELGNLD